MPYPEYIQAFVLGLVQGLTEFIPVSSTGHLVLVREVLGWSDQGLFFDMVIQFATLFAVVVYFWKDWSNFFTSLVMTKGKPITRQIAQSRQLAIYILVANIPTVIFALLLLPIIGGEARSTMYISTMMVGVGLLFFLIEKIGRPNRDLTKMNIFDSIAIGLGQAASVIPGVSRSGATISTGIYQGFKREEAARFSFLVGAPAIFMAGLYSLTELIKVGPSGVDWVSLTIAFISAFIFGYLAIRFMLGYLKSHNLIPFAYYRIIVGSILIIITLLNVRLPWIA